MTDAARPLSFPEDIPPQWGRTPLSEALDAAAAPLIVPRTSVLVVCDQRTPDLHPLLTVLTAELEGVELLVVDARPAGRSLEPFVDGFEGVAVVPPPPAGVAGFAHACELGARHARGEYLVVVDADVSLRHDTVAELVRPLEFWSEIGMVGARCVALDDLTSAAEGTGDIEDVPFAWGCAVAIRRESLIMVGGLEAPLGRPALDVDLASRMRQAGLRVVEADAAVAGSDDPGRRPLPGSTLRERTLTMVLTYGWRWPLRTIDARRRAS